MSTQTANPLIPSNCHIILCTIANVYSLGLTMMLLFCSIPCIEHTCLCFHLMVIVCCFICFNVNYSLDVINLVISIISDLI